MKKMLKKSLVCLMLVVICLFSVNIQSSQADSGSDVGLACCAAGALVAAPVLFVAASAAAPIVGIAALSASAGTGVSLGAWVSYVVADVCLLRGLYLLTSSGDDQVEQDDQGD